MNQLSKYPWLSWYVSNLKSIPGGTYRFGFSKDQTRAAPRITISSFRMGATPVTWGMWKEYCKAESVRMPEKPAWGYSDNHPVVNVSWDEIMDPGGFCEWASGVAGFKLTLPTDAKWEYAARGGKDGLGYPWGNNFDKSKLWASEIYGNTAKTAAVDRTDRIYRNGYGLTDMVGNVWQWCADYHNDDYRPAGKDPVDTQKISLRCVRGGSWSSINPDYFRCADRSGFNPGISSNNIGFRLSAGQK
jgi:formylglycine-generating enzyme required for sulfatase activity